MPTPKKGYRNAAGDRLPGTTTIISRFKDSGGLLQWAFKQGQEGKAHLYEDANKAADIGTVAHLMVEKHINGDDPNTAAGELQLPPEDVPRANNAFAMYLQWERQTNIKMLSKFQEVQLVSPEYQFGGTPDAIGEIDGQVVLLDWKSSNAIYRDYLLQLAAYAHLITYGVRMDTGKPLGLEVNGGAHILRFSKDFPDFEHRYFGELQIAWDQFVLFRKAYELDAELKKRVR